MPTAETLRFYTEKAAEIKNHALGKIRDANIALLKKTTLSPQRKPLNWLDIAKSVGEKASYESREGKTVYIGTYTGKRLAGNEALGEHMEIVFQITEHTIYKRGNLLHFPEVEVETYWTNLYEEPEEVVGLYHARRCTLKLWAKDPWYTVFARTYAALLAL